MGGGGGQDGEEEERGEGRDADVEPLAGGKNTGVTSSSPVESGASRGVTSQSAILWISCFVHVLIGLCSFHHLGRFIY